MFGTSVADSGVVFGWVSASHLVGGGVGASIAGWVRTSTGSYSSAWYFTSGLCFVSVFIALSIPRHRAAVDTGDREPALV